MPGNRARCARAAVRKASVAMRKASVAARKGNHAQQQIHEFILADPKSQKSPKVNCDVSSKNQVVDAIPEYTARLDCEYVLAYLTRSPEPDDTTKSSYESEPVEEIYDLSLQEQCRRNNS
ncbi:hypothetical protein LWI29_025466 [Acer saccharum]|uniref:Uncharacterized protein n=1 Tax=Acer saccharum TaxID=4024 RepID=A0AA39SSG9_ACESA|nr:hypothetical protein LWI29_025466 [Acer saccharum]